MNEKLPVTIQLVEMQPPGTTEPPLSPTIEVSEEMTFAKEFDWKHPGFFYLITQVGEQGNKYISRHICYMRPGHTFAPKTEHLTDRENKPLLENDLFYYRLSHTVWENQPKSLVGGTTRATMYAIRLLEIYDRRFVRARCDAEKRNGSACYDGAV